MAEKIDDQFLVEQFSRGDEAAFEKIVGRYSAEVAALANRLLCWPGEVDDVTQDIFLAAFLSLKDFRRQCSLKTWLFTITINKCRSYRYRRMLRGRQLSCAADKARLPLVSTVADNPMKADTFESIRRVVAAMPAKYREPVVLRYLQELETDEISQILGISRNTLNVRLSRARKRLQQELAELMER